ncbi:MAG TPA: alpha/beta fold hydrolase [Streptosporangiaceae bacterium]|nr:alpha/beta fold hydrolase [Streptosporangiaceae bacterium]
MANAGADRFVLNVAGGRAVEVLTVQDTDGLPLVFNTGTPSGLVPYPPLFDAAAPHGLRCVLYSRPGYGNSDPQPGRKAADAAADVATILDHLGAAEFVTTGWSGGGPHALACAALLPGRCLAAATIAGVAPYQAQGLDWLAGMAPENIEEFGAAMAGQEELEAMLTVAASMMGDLSATDVANVFGDLVTPPDKAVITGEFGDYLAKTTTSAVASGIAGWRDDDLAFVSDWGFSLEQVSGPVSVWQGDQDAMVPFAHGRWLAAHIPGAQPRLVPGEGHLSLVVNHLDDILRGLVLAARTS